MVINSPCLTDKKELAIPGNTELGIKACCCIIIGEKVTTTRQILNADGLKVSTAKKRFLNAHNAVYVAPSLKQKLFSNMKIRFSGVHVPLFETMLLHDQSGQGEEPTVSVESQHTPNASSPSKSQPTTSQETSSQAPSFHEPTTKPITTTLSPHPQEIQIPQITSSMPHDSPLPGGYTPGKLKKTKEVHGKALTKLVKKVKRLEDKLKSTNKRKKAKIVISDEEEEFEHPKNGKDHTIEARRFQEEEQTKVLEQQEQERANLEAALKLQKQFDQERKAADDIDWSKIVEQAQERKAADDINWSKIVEQAQERQSGSMISRGLQVEEDSEMARDLVPRKSS
ncbi:hypothetical protein Tco_1018084 [Tanacetum coccineum]|uniref:Uncharacterized protein n=1 Tax=Tanacetum coccineum TaxID=301880 RepID=A0ABQ5FUE0_9ASTR